MLEIEGARIQLLDLPGIIEGAASGRGRGRQVVSVAKTADLILMILDVKKAEEQKRLLEIELDAIGIRLNKKKPDVLLKPKKTGGVHITSTVPLTKLDEKTIRTIVSVLSSPSSVCHGGIDLHQPCSFVMLASSYRVTSYTTWTSTSGRT